MTECMDDELRDLLPEYALGLLAAEERARLTAHLASCAECRAELVLVRRVAAAHPAPVVDVARIVARLPAAPALAETRGGAGADVLPFRPRAARFAATSSWRRAAAIATIVLGGGASYVALRQGGVRTGSEVPGTVAAPAAPAAISPVATATPRPAPAPARPVPARATRAATTDAARVSLGGMLGDVSASEMETLMQDLERFEGLPSEEPGGVVPAVETVEGNRA